MPQNRDGQEDRDRLRDQIVDFVRSQNNQGHQPTSHEIGDKFGLNAQERRGLMGPLVSQHRLVRMEDRYCVPESLNSILERQVPANPGSVVYRHQFPYMRVAIRFQDDPPGYRPRFQFYGRNRYIEVIIDIDGTSANGEDDTFSYDDAIEVIVEWSETADSAASKTETFSVPADHKLTIALKQTN